MSRISGLNGVRAERGAVFVQVGIAIFVLMAFNVFVIDYGMMWVSRRQAQNAADAGALAGALSRGYDDFSASPPSNGVVANSAKQVAAANLVWQEAPQTDVPSFTCPGGLAGKCVRVDVFRDSAHGNPIGTFFGPLLGVTTQDVMATATAVAQNGNATPCLKPIALPDGWNEQNIPPNTRFSRYVEPSAPPGTLVGNPDIYTPPGASSIGGTSVATWWGERMNWTVGAPLTAPITRELLLPLSLPGTNTFDQNMLQCNGGVLSINQMIPLDTTVTAGSFDLLTQSVYDLDASATYDVGDSDISNTCAPGCAAVSPRLLAIVLYDPDRFQRGRATNDWTGVGCPTNAPCVKISNIAGYFVHCVNSRPCIGGSMPAHGHFLKYPGTTVTTEPTFPDDGSWLVSTHLVR
jgi:hypothetical protein